MKKYTDVILDTAGNALNLATVTVVAYPGGGAVTIYSDDGTTVVASSIVTTNSLGEFSFYAPPGRYNLQVRVAGALVNTITDVQFDEGVSEEVATIAAMKALKGMTDGQICYVTSYYVSAIPDGGGGQFKFDSTSSATANDGTIIAPDAGGVGRWRRVVTNNIIQTNWFGNATLTLRFDAAVTALGGSGGLILIPSNESSGGFTSANLLGGQTVLDARNTGSAGLYYYYEGKTGSQVGLRVDWVGPPIGTNNAIAIYANAENAGDGTNVIAVLGQIDSDSSAAVAGFNKGRGPAVQGDGATTGNPGLGVLGTSGGLGTAGDPAIAVRGDGFGGYGIGGRFQSDAGMPLDARATAAGVSLIGNFEGPSTQGAWVQINATDTGAKKFSLLSSGSATAIGNAKFALHSNNSNTYPFVVDFAAGNSALQIDSSSRIIPSNAMVEVLTNPNYGTTVQIDAKLGNTYRITANNNTAFTIANWGNRSTGQKITIMVRNTSGGALGAITWDTGYKLAAWTSPATANSRSITFIDDGTSFVEISRTPADVPN